MDREKMIEEMVKDISKAVDGNINLVSQRYFGIDANKKYHGMGISFNSVGTAVNLINLGYRKISEGAVVLTKGQQEAIDKGIHDTYLAGRSDGRKETAQEILGMLSVNKFVMEHPLPSNRDYWIAKWICEKFGVEVE